MRTIVKFKPACHLAIVCLTVAMGCSHFSIDQCDVAPDGTRRSTHTEGFTFFDGKSEAAKVRASTTDKTQSQSIGALNQESSSQVVKILIEGASKATVP